MTRFAILSCVGAVLLVSSGVTGASGRAVVRPFEARLNVAANLTPEADACYFINREVGTALSAQLGELTWNDIEAVNFCSVPDGVSVISQFSLTAADGARIFGTFETTGSFTAAGGLSIAGRYRFESGTGRFEGIKGSGSISAEAPPPGSTDPVLGQMRGLMSFPR